MSRTVLVTGAAGVLGNLTARMFAERGDNLVLPGRERAKLEALVRELNLTAERYFIQEVDLGDGEAVRASAAAVASKFSGLHGLIHLVGGWTGGKTLPESDPNEFEFMLRQHVWTTYHLFKYFAPQLAAIKGGRVVVVSHPAASHPAAKSALYAAAKSAQETLALTLAEEFRESGLTANVIQVKSIDVKGVGKGTTPAEIISTIKYLFSDEALKVSGARIPLY